MNGGQRRYRLFVPAGLRPEQPAPLVVNFHGLGGDAASQERLSGFSELAETAVFLVVYPEGLGLRAQGWQIRPGAADVVFIRRLVADLRAEFAIDPARIYATGLSNGGGMVHRLACDAADLFAAVAPVAGAYTFHDDCRPGRPVPILIFHSRDDKVVPFTGSFQTPDLDQFAAAWARRNGCAGQAVESEPTPRARLSQWSNCDGSTALYALADTGHHWPGSRLGPDSLPASTLIWDFFQTQTLAP